MPFPSWVLSGILALLLGLYVANNVRGQDHGADQPQNPKTGKFITENEDFWRWIIGGLAVAAITAYVGSQLAPAVNDFLKNTPLTVKTAIGIWGLVILKAAFGRFS